MRKAFYTAFLLSLSILGYGQKKKFFFDHIDMTLNAHVGDASIQKESWPGLFKKGPGAYSVDTFYYSDFGRARCVMFPFIPTSISAGLRFSKYLFPKSEHRLVKERVEWRAGFLLGTTTESSSYYTSHDFRQPPPAAGYSYTELYFLYRRRWIDLNNQLVYKIPSFLLKKNLKYYLGTGAGITGEVSSRVKESVVQFNALPVATGYNIVELSRAERNEKAKTVMSPYFSFTCGSEIRCGESWYVLLEATSQVYTNSFNQKKTFI